MPHGSLSGFESRLCLCVDQNVVSSAIEIKTLCSAFINPFVKFQHFSRFAFNEN